MRKISWHPDLDVFFQQDALMNTKVCLEWIEKQLEKFVTVGKPEKHVFFY